MAVVSDGAGIYSEAAPQDGDIVGARRREALAAAKVLGIKEVHFLDFADGKLALFKNEIRRKIEGLICALAPGVVFAPSPLDFHEDHRAVSSVAMSFLNGTKKVKLAFYEVYGTLRFNCIVDITAVLGVKEKAVLSYPCSLYHAPHAYADAIKGLNRFRSFYAGGKGYYEAFWIVENPLSGSEITDWLTYGGKEGSSCAAKDAERDVLKAAVEEKGKDVAMLSCDLAAKKEELAAVTLQLEETNIRLADITGSSFWRTAAGFYRIRDRMLPLRSLRRRIYDRIMSRFKRM